MRAEAENERLQRRSSPRAHEDASALLEPASAAVGDAPAGAGSSPNADEGHSGQESGWESLTSRLRSGIFWNLVAGVFNQGSTFVVNILVARILGRQVFGEYAIFQSTLLTAATLLQLSMGYTATKYIAEYHATDKKRTARILGLGSLITYLTGGVGALVLILGSPWLTVHALRLPADYSSLLILSSGYLLFTTVNGFQMGVLVGLRSYRSLAVAGLGSGIASMLLIAGAAYSFGLTGAVAGMTLAAMARAFLHRFSMSAALRDHHLRPIFTDLGSERVMIFRFALPAAAIGYITLCSIWFGNFLIVSQAGGFKEMALYSAATNIRYLVFFLPNVINTVGLSMLNQAKGRRDSRQYNRLLWANLILICVITLSAVLGIGFFGDLVMGLFGKDFPKGQPVLWALLLSTLPEAMSMVLYQITQTHAKLWHALVVVTIPRELLFVALVFAWTPSYGALGAGYAYLCAQGLGLLTNAALAASVHFGRLREEGQGRDAEQEVSLLA